MDQVLRLPPRKEDRVLAGEKTLLACFIPLSLDGRLDNYFLKS